MTNALRVHVEYPGWVDALVNWERACLSDEDKMRLAVAVARENVLRETGGPFGAAVFEAETGRLVSVGMNLVVRLRNSVLHAEIVAFMMAQARVKLYTLHAPDLTVHELVSTCEPCAMCLGATLWSGVRRVVCGATRDDVSQLKFEEGPVFPASYAYLEARGIEIVRGVGRAEARAVLDLYAERGGVIYNG